jgi:tRNA nucleotidyltransferase (CCA-adding enzyme)
MFFLVFMIRSIQKMLFFRKIMNLSGEKYDKIHEIVAAIAQHKGRALLVGGAVRDMVMHLAIKDVDIEVYGLTEQELENILKQFGPVSLVGKAFGVLRIHGLDVDWSLPRADSPGRKPTVVIDPHMPVETAARRRDLTMNAMAFDLITEQLIDPCGGMTDIKNKLLCTPDSRFFVQDPLRFYRVMQFIGRFEMMPDDELTGLCREMDISAVSRERIEEEFKKLLLRSTRPSLGIRWLHAIGRLQEILPELYDTVGIEQEPQWHPEGDVFEHSMQALDAAAIIAQKYDDEFDKLILLYAALCHDLGKVTTTREVNGVIKSIGHEKESKKCARTMMKRITHNGDLIDAVSSLVLHHMTPLQFTKNKAKLPAYQRLADKLSSLVNMSMLIDLCIADKRGRNGAGHIPLGIDFPDVAEFKEKTDRAGVMLGGVEPLLKGADIVDIVSPGPEMGRILRLAYDIQIEKSVTDKNILREYVVAKMRK